MLLKKLEGGSWRTLLDQQRHRLLELARRRPLPVLTSVLGLGLLAGVAGSFSVAMVDNARLHAKLDHQQAELAQVREQSRIQTDALAARLGELQAQANRLNALGQRLTAMGKLDDGEFDFQAPVGVGGGDEPAQDMSAAEVSKGVDQLEQQFAHSGKQLDVLASLLFDHQLEQNAVPSRMPVANTYITSGFGRRADPFRGGASEHKGIDFHARIGDPVMSVADGVVGFAGVRRGYGNVVEVDHGNGYLTRYAHNSRLLVKPGDLVHAGQEIAKAGSTGRSTGAHVHFEVWQNGRVMNPTRFLGDNAPVSKVHRG